MAQDIKTLTGEAGLPKEGKRGFRPFAALAEGLRKRRERRCTISLLEDAVRFGEKDAFDEAMASFIALPQEQKERVMLEMQKALKSASYLPFESEEKTARVAAIAGFFEKAATALPVDSEGERIVAPYQETVRILKDVVEGTAFRSRANPAQGRATLACTRALWELEYGNFDFWEARALEHSTGQFAITKLLEMPDTGDYEAHGWFLLRKNLAQLGEQIARNPSEQRVAFFRAMLMDAENSVVKAALRDAVHLENIPPDFPGIAQDVLEIPELEDEARMFISATHALAKLQSDEPYVSIAMLAMQYSDGARHLGPILERAGERMASDALDAKSGPKRIRAMDTLATLAAAGITPCSPDTLVAILGPLTGSRELPTQFYGLTGNILFSGKKHEGLTQVAAKMESDRVNSCFTELGYADDRQFPAALELVSLFASGRMYLVTNGMIPEVAKEMAEIVLEPAGETKKEQDEQVRKAKFVLEAMRGAGIEIQFNYSAPEQGETEGHSDEG